MKKIEIYNWVKVLILFLFAIFLTLAEVVAEVDSFVDHFDSPELNSIWNIKTRNGGYFINDWKNGRLMLVSSQVQDGICLNYTPEITDRYATFEVKLDTSYLTENIHIGFADQIMIPSDNEEVNAHILGGIAIIRNGWWIRLENGLKEGKFQKGWHVFSGEVYGEFIKFYVDGVYVGRKRKSSGSIYFCISADAYTNYYTAKVAIDYIKIKHGE